MGWVGFTLGRILVLVGEWIFDNTAKYGWRFVQSYSNKSSVEEFTRKRHAALMVELVAAAKEGRAAVETKGPAKAPFRPRPPGTFN